MSTNNDNLIFLGENGDGQHNGGNNNGGAANDNINNNDNRQNNNGMFWRLLFRGENFFLNFRIK